MPKICLSLAVLLISSYLQASSVDADVIYSNGDPGWSGQVSTYNLLADDFTLSENTYINGASISLYGVYKDQWNTNGEWAIFDDAAGSPGGLLATGFTTNNQKTDTTFPGFDNLYFEFGQDFYALANETYWFAFHSIDYPVAYSTGIYWGGTNSSTGYDSKVIPFTSMPISNDPLLSSISYSPFWTTPLPRDLAFQLHSVPVPEPSAFILLMSGLVGLALVTRLRRKC